MTVTTPKQFFSTNPYATLANDSNRSVDEVDVQLRRRVTAKKRAQLAIDRQDSGLTDPEDDDDDEEKENTLRAEAEEQEIQEDTGVYDDSNIFNREQVDSNLVMDELLASDVDDIEDEHVHTNNTKKETFEEETHENTKQGSVRDLRKHDSVVTDEEEEKDDDQDINETLLSKELEPITLKKDDMEEYNNNQDTLDALMTAMTTPTTPPPVMTIMHGGFFVLIFVLGALAVYTWGMPGNWVVWFLFAVNVPLWALVTKLAASIGADEYPTINESLIKSEKEIITEEGEEEEEFDKDELFDPDQPRKISKTEMETIQRIIDLVES